MKIGIYPGTFDPVHNGHIAFAQAAMRECGLDKVVFLPERMPRDKTNITSIEHRMAMLRHAIRPFVKLDVMDSTDQRFTVTETLPFLQNQFAGAELTILLGSDVVKTFAYRWPALHELLLSCSIAVGMRVGDDVQLIEEFLNNLQASLNVPITATYVQSHMGHSASSRVRNNAGVGGVNEIPPAVSDYIIVNQLYTV